MKSTFIIAEAGVNHNGDLKIAEAMIDVAREAGVDAVKFQTFRAEELATGTAPQAPYQRRNADGQDSQLGMLKGLELDRAAHQRLLAHCEKKGVRFLSSAFDLKSVDLLDQLGLTILKIPSGEITNLPYLRKIGGLKKELIVSTGMSTMEEIGSALEVLTGAGTPKDKITLLHCHTEYPTAFADVHLRAMVTMQDAFGVKVGYSDHTLGIEAAVAAVALGATVIEKHFTLDRNLPGPDHRASLEPEELKALVRAVRNTEQALGTAEKAVGPCEKENQKVVRKSIVAARDIKKGERFSEENLTTKRPAAGISPTAWDRVVGEVAQRDFRKDEFIEL